MRGLAWIVFLVAVGYGVLEFAGIRSFDELQRFVAGPGERVAVAPGPEPKAGPITGVETPRRSLSAAVAAEDEKVRRLARDIEKKHPQFDPASPTFDASVVSQALTRKAFHQFVNKSDAAEALTVAVGEMQQPAASRGQVVVRRIESGGCQYYGAQNRKYVQITGGCPAVGVGSSP